MWLKYGISQGFLAYEVVITRCNNLLTMGVDKRPRVGL
jgi:hypothetical protein